MSVPKIYQRDGMGWREFNAHLAEECRLHRFTRAALEPGGMAVICEPGPGAPILAQAWPIKSDDPELVAERHLGAAADRCPAGRLAWCAAGGVFLIIEQLNPAQAAEERTVGRPPFGFQASASGWIPDPEEASVVLAIYRAEDGGMTDLAGIGKLIVGAFPWLLRQMNWRDGNRRRAIGRILARREELEPLLVNLPQPMNQPRGAV